MQEGMTVFHKLEPMRDMGGDMMLCKLLFIGLAVLCLWIGKKAFYAILASNTHSLKMY